MSQPSYLGNEDFILKKDCQKAIPELEKLFAKNQEKRVEMSPKMETSYLPIDLATLREQWKKTREEL